MSPDTSADALATINIRNLVTDENVEKFPDFNPAIIVGFVAEVAACEAVMVTYSNEVSWEVRIN